MMKCIYYNVLQDAATRQSYHLLPKSHYTFSVLPAAPCLHRISHRSSKYLQTSPKSTTFLRLTDYLICRQEYSPWSTLTDSRLIPVHILLLHYHTLHPPPPPSPYLYPISVTTIFWYNFLCFDHIPLQQTDQRHLEENYKNYHHPPLNSTTPSLYTSTNMMGSPHNH